VAMMDGRLADARHLAQTALELSIRIGEWYVRAYASIQMARVTLESGDWQDAQRHAVESIVAARRLHNMHVASYGLELWASAMLAGGLLDEAGRRFVLAERGYRQTGSGPWRTDPELHRHRADLRAALGERYERASAEARDSDFDEAITELLAVDRPGA
jgi:ATP/maltotriose-dependent transcriptional regulator MalT